MILTLESKEIYDTENAAFDNAMIEIGVLGGVILLLSFASYLVRRKEREPEEEQAGSE